MQTASFEPEPLSPTQSHTGFACRFKRIASVYLSLSFRHLYIPLGGSYQAVKSNVDRGQAVASNSPNTDKVS